MMKHIVEKSDDIGITDLVPVTQADREAAAKRFEKMSLVWLKRPSVNARMARDGKLDDHPVVQGCAKRRISRLDNGDQHE